jgi:hypothetical protein
MGVNSDPPAGIQQSLRRLLDYCKSNEWAGFDPYDGLNSRVFSRVPFLQNKICRLVFTQLVKRFPINLRPLLLVPKEQNPKGLALFASALIRLSDFGLVDGSDLTISILNDLIWLRTPDTPHLCWGYNFDWQNRSFFLPKFKPNIICSTFAANAILDAYEKYGNTEYLDMAVSTGHFLLSGLNISKNDDGICFSYTPFDRSRIHNANLLGAALLARLYGATGEINFLEVATEAVGFSVSKQNEDGSWPYGENRNQKWIDNFHTGYNLVALKKFSEHSGNGVFIESIRKGYDFYIKSLFTTNCIPKYYHDRTYPIDIHSIAQSIITFAEMERMESGSLDLATSTCNWAVKNMQTKQGYFFYQQGRFFKNRISYMRWSQAWMLYALAAYLKNTYARKSKESLPSEKRLYHRFF